MSQLLQRLEADLQITDTLSERGKLLARKSAYLARIGRFEDSKSIVCELRRDFGDSRSSNVTIWIMLAEGLLHYYENLDAEAHDRIARAQLLSKAIGDEELAAITSAWRAHLEFERSDFRAMVTSVKTAFKFMLPENYAAQTRVSMVLSDCHFLCGDRAGGQKWFLRSRDTALKEGDQASIEALLYNKAAFSLAWLRAQRSFGAIAPDQLSLLRLELASARNLQNIAGINALTHVVHLCEARLLMLEEKYEEGISKLEAIRNAAPYGEYNFNQSMIDLEIEYCRYRLDPNEVRLPRPIWSFDALDIDEQMLAAWMIMEIYSNASVVSEIEEMAEMLSERRSGYSKTISELRLMLTEFADA